MKIIKLNAIDSTNSYLKQLAKATCLQDETVVLTNRQISGRGQMGNVWLSREGQSLTFSMFKAFGRLQIERQFMISMAVSLAIVKALKSLNVPNISIKWPNDILSANKKIGGILIENVLEGNYVNQSIIGIGLNVNETDFLKLPQASSLKLETGKTFFLEEVFQSIVISVFQNLKDLTQKNFEDIKLKYENELFQKEKVSVFEAPDGLRFNGIIKGISEIGELLVETENQALRKFQLKEVKLIY
ncbi:MULTISPECIES: biotin--[acetyl-CoA-carboxylase] ligase [Aequorivita]|uniref:Biotin--[acetyl-CoA-carboxylase] ligase n=1 Tax=Aequorivita iocasae TaxID=2803865 RepID=A0ABX7DS45_9FLAO|nr:MULTISPECIES: biotin--[acetyl-CoA-carboxylase] ligase [Aequorivita]QQX76918.1 biotin--[acetyl-CoA-carboxylase] ligase [Aequorivita iocasae]UCA56395.1 biotin--[acetyl-CoA-carboxylase] ligase [Aequorivita sp. F7]